MTIDRTKFTLDEDRFDLTAYERYLSASMEDYEYPAEMAAALKALDALPVG